MVGWDWAGVAGGRSVGGTTWGDWHVGGPLCLVERDAPSTATLAGVQAQVADAEARRHLGPLLESWPDERQGVVAAQVWVADRAALDYARLRWHGLVDLRAALTPVG